MDLQTISALASAGFFVATYLIVQPLKLSIINALQISVDRLAVAMEKVQSEVGENNEELARVEEKIKTIFTRLDSLDNRIRHVEERCENCQCRD